VAFGGHFGDPFSNFLAPLNNFGTDEAMHLKFGRQIVFSNQPTEAILAHRHVHSFARSVSDS